MGGWVGGEQGWGVMVSHRSGETEDTTIADLVVGLGTGQVPASDPPAPPPFFLLSTITPFPLPSLHTLLAAELLAARGLRPPPPSLLRSSPWAKAPPPLPSLPAPTRDIAPPWRRRRRSRRARRAARSGRPSTTSSCASRRSSAPPRSTRARSSASSRAAVAVAAMAAARVCAAAAQGRLALCRAHFQRPARGLCI